MSLSAPTTNTRCQRAGSVMAKFVIEFTEIVTYSVIVECDEKPTDETWSDLVDSQAPDYASGGPIRIGARELDYAGRVEGK